MLADGLIDDLRKISDELKSKLRTKNKVLLKILFIFIPSMTVKVTLQKQKQKIPLHNIVHNTVGRIHSTPLHDSWVTISP